MDQPENVREALIRGSRGQTILWVLATILALVGWDLFPGEVVRIVYAYVLTTAALAIWCVTRALVAAHPIWDRTGFDDAFKPPPMIPRVPEELERVQRAVTFSRFSAFDAHGRVRPLLREIADAQLTARYGRGLDVDPEDVRARLRLEVWEAVRPREGFPDRDAPGISLSELDQIVRALEELAQL
jgi:hypothetical protein